MIKNKSSFEVKVGEKLYQFFCEPDSPIEQVLQVLNIMTDHIKKVKVDLETQEALKREQEVKTEVLEG